jgi:uncharacterized membrane protein YidH (DUF202 family)
VNSPGFMKNWRYTAMSASILQGLGLCAVGIWLFIESLSIRSLGYDALDAPFFPKLSAVLLIIFGAAIALSAALKKETKLQKERNRRSYTKVILYMCMLIAYAIAVKSLGFVVTTIFFIFISYLMMAKKISLKEIIYSITFACATTFAFWYIFEKGLKVILP